MQWITACVILHNIFLEIQDDWDEEEGWWTPEEEEAHETEIKIATAKQLIEGTTKREYV